VPKRYRIPVQQVFVLRLIPGFKAVCENHLVSDIETEPAIVKYCATGQSYFPQPVSGWFPTERESSMSEAAANCGS
jgi:hypothetical protein